MNNYVYIGNVQMLLSLLISFLHDIIELVQVQIGVE